MKKVLLIMAAALMTMTQCRKQETVPATPSANTIKMTITAGPGAKTNITDDGAITWSKGDVLYVSDGAKWLGNLTLVGEGGSASGRFTGDISGISDGTTCHFFYLGHDNGMTPPTKNTATEVSISFASQDGSKVGAFKYHLGHGKAVVTVSEGVATGAVGMSTKIAIAHLKLKMNGEDYTGSVTMNVSNTMTVSPTGTFNGSDNGNGITIGGTSGDRYVTLIPTTGTESVNVNFSGSATGSMTFGHGIQANNLYGMAAGIEVTLEAASAPKFSVGENTTVEFAPGNLYWDGSAFRFEANQWDTKPAYSETDGGFGNWDASHVSHFKWSDAANAVTDDYIYSGDLFCANNFTVAGDSHTWRTLSEAEWNYLLNRRTNASSLRAWVTLTDVSVWGLVLLPDGSTATASGITTSSALADAGAVFLPAAGKRDSAAVGGVGSLGFYWSSTPYEGYAYYMTFDSGYAGAEDYDTRAYGRSVRLVW